MHTEALGGPSHIRHLSPLVALHQHTRSPSPPPALSTSSSQGLISVHNVMSNEARQGQPTPMDPHRQRWLPTLALLPHYCPTACTRTQILQQPRRSHATHCPAAAGLLLSLEQAAGCCACAWARCQGTSHSHTHSSTHIARALKPQWCSQHHPPPNSVAPVLPCLSCCRPRPQPHHPRCLHPRQQPRHPRRPAAPAARASS